jgi:hypothetical protein
MYFALILQGGGKPFVRKRRKEQGESKIYVRKSRV